MREGDPWRTRVGSNLAEARGNVDHQRENSSIEYERNDTVCHDDAAHLGRRHVDVSGGARAANDKRLEEFCPASLAVAGKLQAAPDQPFSSGA